MSAERQRRNSMVVKVDSSSSSESEWEEEVEETREDEVLNVPLSVICPLTVAERVLFVLITQNPQLLDLFHPWMRDIYLDVYRKGANWIGTLFH